MANIKTYARVLKTLKLFFLYTVYECKSEVAMTKLTGLIIRHLIRIVNANPDTRHISNRFGEYSSLVINDRVRIEVLADSHTLDWQGVTVIIDGEEIVISVMEGRPIVDICGVNQLVTKPTDETV